MFQEPLRARRRRERLNAIARVERFLRNQSWERPGAGFVVWRDDQGRERRFHSWDDIFAYRRAAARRRHAHRQSCSCHMCGNPRRYFDERTLQERRADEAARANDI